MNLKYVKDLQARNRALVCIAVLLDGMEAVSYLEQDSELGNQLASAANYLASQQPELRMPLVGSLLRDALAEMR